MIPAGARDKAFIKSSSTKKLSDNVAVWSEMKDLAIKYQDLSLGEGAPNLMPPQFLLDEMTNAMKVAGNN